MYNSLYWDDFERRIEETVNHIGNKTTLPIRRVAVFITNRCNFRCKYCKVNFASDELSEERFNQVVDLYGNDAIIHITGGEPSVVKWLYSYIENRKGIRFHLNTNAFLEPPSNIKRLKVSLDSFRENYFNELVGNKFAFKRVVNNIKEKSKSVVTSITCVLNKENYMDSPKFMEFCRKEFPNLYAVFFSVYKGDDKRFVFNEGDANTFFNIIRPKLENEMDKESLYLFKETIDEKNRILAGVRFPENKANKICYLSLSERVIDWKGNEYNCSHLYRDGICHKDSGKDVKCLYGCNRRLVMFNEEVERRLGARSEQMV